LDDRSRSGHHVGDGSLEQFRGRHEPDEGGAVRSGLDRARRLRHVKRPGAQGRGHDERLPLSVAPKNAVLADVEQRAAVQLHHGLGRRIGRRRGEDCVGGELHVGRVPSGDPPRIRDRHVALRGIGKRNDDITGWMPLRDTKGIASGKLCIAPNRRVQVSRNVTAPALKKSRLLPDDAHLAAHLGHLRCNYRSAHEGTTGVGSAAARLRRARIAVLLRRRVHRAERGNVGVRKSAVQAHAENRARENDHRRGKDQRA